MRSSDIGIGIGIGLALAIGCTPSPMVHPVDTLPRGDLSVILGTSVGLGRVAPRPGLGKELVVDYIPSVRVGISSRCDAAGGLSFTTSVLVDARCAITSARDGAPVSVIPFVGTSYTIATALATGAYEGFGARGGVDVSPVIGSRRPFFGVAVGLANSWYRDDTKPKPIDGPVDPRTSRREVRLDATIGIQFATFDAGKIAVSLALTPYWRISDDASAVPAGLGFMFGVSPPL